MYRSVRFRSTIPAPWGDGFVLPESRVGTDRIAEALAGRVSTVSSVEQHESYGWGFWTRFDGCTFDNVVNPLPEECYLTVSMNSYLLRWITFRKPRRTFDCYCDALEEALRTMPEVSDITRENYRS